MDGGREGGRCATITTTTTTITQGQGHGPSCWLMAVCQCPPCPKLSVITASDPSKECSSQSWRGVLPSAVRCLAG